jgi:subtilisin family serine protease
MKKSFFEKVPNVFRNCISVFLLIFLCQIAQAQIYYDTICWVWVNDKEFIAEEGLNFSSRDELNSLLSQNQVEFYEKALPFAKNPELLKIHEIRCNKNGNIDSLINNLSSSFPSQFDRFSKFEIIDSIYVYDPIDYMWVAHADDWLWYLKKIQADYAWDITKGNPNIKTAVIDTDFDVIHPDLAAKIDPHYDPYSGYEYSCINSNNEWYKHGTTVASFVAAETTEQGGSAQGQLASVGFNTKMIAYKSEHTTQEFLQKALHASNVMGADVIVSCAGGSLRCFPTPDSGEELIVKEILDNGTVIVMPAGNGPHGSSCGTTGNQHAFYPFNPEYDERIIIVTSTDNNDSHQVFNGSTEVTHSHYPEVDICAPGFNMMGASITHCDVTQWPYYGANSGTSFASPIVAGVCALLKSINKDFTPGEIQEFIKSTADPVTDGDNYIGQIGTGRINAFRAVEMAYNCAPINVTTNETWIEDKVITCGIIVKNNSILTIQSNVKLSKHSAIIIEPGGKLIIESGKLTSLDNLPWQGIQVWGHRDSTQYTIPGQTCPQGKLILKNGAIIENAITAVDLWNPNDYTSTGGIVLAEDAIFRNNTRAVHALNYRNFNPYNPNTEVDNLSYFKNCTFEITPDYLAVETFYKHADLSKVKGIRFSGCDFTLSPDANGVSEYNQGIASYSAGFWVDALCTSQQLPCTAYDSCHFTGFYSGIYATKDLTSVNTFYVNKAIFTDNAYGIKVYMVKDQTIINSTFNVGYNHSIDSTLCTAPVSYGIYLDNSTGFAVEENSFSKAVGNPSAKYTGIRVITTNASDEIYKNNFSGLSYGNYASGINHEIDIWKGLSYFCNNNESNYADFYVEKIPPSGIQPKQGDLTHSTGNTFSSTGAIWHFFNGGDSQIDYYYCALCQEQNPDNLKTFNVIEHANNQTNTCPSHYGGGTIGLVVLSEQQKLEREQSYADALVNYMGVNTLYNNLKDGGSTALTLTDIQAAQPQDMWNLRATLLGDSPHLSGEVLKQVANKTDVFTESVIFDILAANPDELKNEELLKYLEDKANPLPSYMIDILRQVAAGTTYKTVLQQEMARYNQEKTRAANDMIRSYLNDSITDFVQVRNWLDNRGGIEADKQIIATYAQEDNYTFALSLATMLPSLYNLQGIELTEHNQFMQLLGIQQTLLNENRHIETLSSGEIAILNTIADSSKGSAGAAAKGILESYYGEHYCNCPDMTDEAAYKNTNVDPNALSKVYGLNITAKPNPARDWAAFDYILPESVTNATLIITDAMGKTVETFNLTGQQGQQVWDTRSIEAGTYIYTLKVAGYNTSGKIVLSK